VVYALTTATTITGLRRWRHSGQPDRVVLELSTKPAGDRDLDQVKTPCAAKVEEPFRPTSRDTSISILSKDSTTPVGYALTMVHDHHRFRRWRHRWPSPDRVVLELSTTTR